MELRDGDLSSRPLQDHLRRAASIEAANTVGSIGPVPGSHRSPGANDRREYRLVKAGVRPLAPVATPLAAATAPPAMHDHQLAINVLR